MGGVTCLGSEGFHLVDDVSAFYDLPEDNMLIIQPMQYIQRNIKLTPIGILLPTVCHRKKIRLIMPMPEVLIVKVNPVDTLSTLPISIGDITALYHEVLYDSVEDVSLVVEFLACFF